MPKKFLIPLHKSPAQLLTLSQIHPAKLCMPSHKPRTRFFPTSAICEKPLLNPLIMAESICGTAFTISIIIIGRFVMSEVNRSIPVCIIKGILSISASITDVIILGIAVSIISIISGKAWMSVTNRLMPASIMSGKFSTIALMIPSIIRGIASITTSIISGKAPIKLVNSWMPVSII